MYTLAYQWMEKDRLPDPIIRLGIRRLLKKRLQEEQHPDDETQRQKWNQWVRELEESPISIQEEAANEQHYEVPPEFFEACLGKRLKYSCAYWPDGVKQLDEAEEEMFSLYCERAQLQNGQKILDLGCGWGSTALYLAEKFPGSQVVALSNSAPQKEFIDNKAKEKGFSNLEVLTGNIRDFEMEDQFDRVVSIEMFEHMRNYGQLMKKVASWLKPEGLLFVHIFCHRELSYPFEEKDETDWMSKYFFTGGMMPSEDLLLCFQEDLKIKEHWRVNGVHYQKTCEAWLKNMDQVRDTVLGLFEKVYGKEDALKRFVYWRVFYMACAELFGYNKGKEWFVSHYLFQK